MLLATAFGSTTSLTASIPADKLLDGAVASVTVSSPAPGGGTSQGVSFSVNNPVPTVASVSPSGVLAGSAGAMLDVSGTGFGFHRNRLPRREEPHYAARVPRLRSSHTRSGIRGNQRFLKNAKCPFVNLQEKDEGKMAPRT
jgi:hypothetical protein